MSSRMLVHPRMLPGLALFYPSLCTIQSATLAQDAVGEPQPTWANVLLLILAGAIASRKPAAAVAQMPTPVASSGGST